MRALICEELLERFRHALKRVGVIFGVVMFAVFDEVMLGIGINSQVERLARGLRCLLQFLIFRGSAAFVPVLIFSSGEYNHGNRKPLREAGNVFNELIRRIPRYCARDLFGRFRAPVKLLASAE